MGKIVKITREEAIERIIKIANLIFDKDLEELLKLTDEDKEYIKELLEDQPFRNGTANVFNQNINFAPTHYLEEKLSIPIYRTSKEITYKIID